MQNYSASRAQLREHLQVLEADIRSVLAKTAKNLEVERKQVDRGEFEEMGRELNFKEAQTQNAKQTLVRVKQELLRRRTDFLKVTQFERLFPEKIKSLRERLASIQKDIAQYNNADQEQAFLEGAIGRINCRKATEAVGRVRAAGNGNAGGFVECGESLQRTAEWAAGASRVPEVFE